MEVMGVAVRAPMAVVTAVVVVVAAATAVAMADAKFHMISRASLR